MNQRFKITKTESLPHSEVQITGEITLSFLVELRPVALKHLNEHAEMPGFRSGHIPENVLIKRVGEMRIAEESAELALGREYGNILNEAKVSPVGRPDIAITRLAPEAPLEFKIRVAVEPEFDLPDYKKVAKNINLEAKPPSEVGVTDKKVQIIEKLVKETDILVPRALVESELERMLAQFKGNIERTLRQGSGQVSNVWQEYLKKINKSEEDVKGEWQEQALQRVKAELIIAKIVQTEKIEPAEAEIEHEVKHLLEHYPDADPLRARIYLYTQLRNQKIFEFLENLT